MSMTRNVWLNTHALQRTALDSARLGVLGTIVHPLPDKGRFEVTVLAGDSRIASVPLRIDPDDATTQVDIDLAALDPGRRIGSRAASGGEAVVGPKGYLVVTVSEGAGEYRVVLTAPGSRDRKPAFDSRALQPGDLFVAMLLRPGSYELSGDGVRATGTLRVAYPGSGKERLADLEAARVRVTEKGFEPQATRVHAGQGTVFEVAARDVSVRVTLQEPDDGPDAGKPAPRRHHWVKPGGGDVGNGPTGGRGREAGRTSGRSAGRGGGAKRGRSGGGRSGTPGSGSGGRSGTRSSGRGGSRKKG